MNRFDWIFPAELDQYDWISNEYGRPWIMTQDDAREKDLAGP